MFPSLRLLPSLLLFWPVLFLTQTACLARTPPTGPKAFGRIHYPADQLANLRQGSFEIIVTLNFDPARVPKTAYTAPMSFFLLSDHGGPSGKPRELMHFRSMTTYRARREEGQLLTELLGEGDAVAALALGGRMVNRSLRIPARQHGLKKGATVHLGFTWTYEDGAYRCAVYLNGTRLREQLGGGVAPFRYGADAAIWIGSPHYRSAYGTLHALRFSSVARSPEAFRAAGENRRFEADEATLYIEDFRSLDSAKTGPQPLGRGGRLDGAYLIHETGDGRRAVQLNAYDEEDPL